MTTGEALIEKGRREGVETGRRGMVRALSQQVTSRFGSLRVWDRATIESARVEQLEQWFDRVLTAGSVEELLS